MSKITIKHSTKTKIGVAIKIIIGLMFISPIFIGLIFSFVPDEELYALPTVRTVIDNLTIKNYIKVFKTLPIFSYIKTSLVMCFMVIVVQIAVSSLSAYAFAFLTSRLVNFFSLSSPYCTFPL